MRITILTICIYILIVNNVIGQETQIRGFADAQFGMIKNDSSTTSNRSHGFAVGQYDLFIISQINDRVSFIGETVFEWDSEENLWALDVERVIIKYAVRDYFNISAGKFHTAFGYWNNAYHHGAVIQPTINRPVIVRFEDNGGYLPVHQVGLQLSGTGITNKNFGYTFFVSNGQSQGNTGGGFDYNSTAISGSISLEPIENLKLIASAFSTSVPKGSTTFQGILLSNDTRYTLLNGAVSYFNPSAPVEFVVEYFNINNSMISTFTSNAYFIYLGLNIIKKFTPYVLYNKVSFQQGESYFLKNDIDELTVGARYLIWPKVVWKLEYTTSHSEMYNNSSLIQSQFAIGF